MSEHDLLRCMERARLRLTALQARLELTRTPTGSPEFNAAVVELVQMVGQLEAHCGLLREILVRTDEAFFAKDRDGRYVVINRKGAAMLGRPVEEILGQNDLALLEPQTAAQVMAVDREIMRTGTSQTSESAFDVAGLPVTMLVIKAAWYDPPGVLRGVIGTARDVSERKRLDHGAEGRQERLRSLASEIVVTEERLRQTLAADLQNGLGQDIALAMMKLSALRTVSSLEMSDPLAKIERLMEQADRSLRSITFRISPPALHDLGLVPALQWLAEDIGGRFDLDTRIEDEATPAVTDDRMRVMLFRAVRELLMNTATHARAHAACVHLDSVPGSFRIAVADDGAGFDPARVELGGYGLFGIGEQLKHVGGNMKVDSAPGRGTTVTLTVPSVTG
ncbi:MAG: PAS domain-containing protein [Planctomycetota bacterium]